MLEELSTSPSPFLESQDAVNIWKSIIQMISQFACTGTSKERLKSWVPFSRSLLPKIESRRDYVRQVIDFTALIKNEITSLEAFLKEISPLGKPSGKIDSGSRIVCTLSEEIYERFSTGEIGKHCDVQLLESMEELETQSEYYDETIFITDMDFMSDQANMVFLTEEEASDPLKILPELGLEFFAINRNSLFNSSNVCKVLQDYSSNDLLSNLSKKYGFKFEDFLGISVLLDQLTEAGEIVKDVDEEYSRLQEIVSKLDVTISETESEINDRLREHIEETRLELSGEKIMHLLQSEGELSQPEFRGYLNEALSDTIEEVLGDAEEKLCKQLDLQDEETSFVEELFPREVSYPIEAESTRRKLLESYTRRKWKGRAYELKMKLAVELQDFLEPSEKAIQVVQEIDFALTIGKFFSEYQLKLPKLFSDRTGLGFVGGLNPPLMKSNIKIDPVNYSLGDVDLKPKKIEKERIVLLSGANSGGKTTLIITAAYFVILSQMGLGTPAQETEIGLFDSIRFYRKTSGTQDAGAFESTLKTLSSMLLSKGNGIVLADEMEAISEPGASARVIATFLDLLYEQEGSCGIFVSHLAEEIQKVITHPIRVDGIQASGLDEDLNLIVDRSPKYYCYARSTPQLIVERLTALASDKSEEKRIFGEILSRLQSEVSPDDLALKTQITTFAEKFKDISEIYQEEMAKPEPDATAGSILSLYTILLEQVFGGTLYFKLLLLLHGDKTEWTRDEITMALGYSPAATLKAIRDLANAGFVKFNDETQTINLTQKLF